MCVCACACAFARARACMRACACVCSNICFRGAGECTDLEKCVRVCVCSGVGGGERPTERKKQTSDNVFILDINLFY